MSRLFFHLKTVTIVVMASSVLSLHAQVEVSGSVDVVGKNYREGRDYTNNSFSGQNPFSAVRGRLFFDSKVSENTSAFVQLITDGGGFLGVYGAYLRVEHLFGSPFNLQVGKIPGTVGTWSARTYASKNPLIGTPLLWVHHTALSPGDLGATPTTLDLLALRDSRPASGLPVLYDFCWNSGAELYGALGKFDFSLAALQGSVTEPAVGQLKEIPQGTARLAYNFSPGFILGGSGFYGPYIIEDYLNFEFPKSVDLSTYMNAGGGGDLYLAHGEFEFYSEVFYTSWQYPNLPLLQALCGYVEGKYKFTPGWYLAARADDFEPGKIRSGQKDVTWDYAVQRYEFGLGFKPNRNLTVKAVSQLNRFPDAPKFNFEHYAVQMALEFH